MKIHNTSLVTKQKSLSAWSVRWVEDRTGSLRRLKRSSKGSGQQSENIQIHHWFSWWDGGCLSKYQLSTWHNLESLLKKRVSVNPYQGGLWIYLWGVVLIVSVDVGEPGPLWAGTFPWQVALGDLRKVANEELTRSKPASKQHPPRFLLYLVGCEWVPGGK